MIKHVLTIKRTGNSLKVKRVDSAGNETDATHFHVDPNQDANVSLCWRSDGGEFAVLFDNDRNPFVADNKVHTAHRTQETKTLKVRNLRRAEQNSPIGDPVNGATFKYGVAVLHPTSGEVLTLDPDIIIDDPFGH